MLIPLTLLNVVNGWLLLAYGAGQQMRDRLFVEAHYDAIWNVATRGKQA